MMEKRSNIRFFATALAATALSLFCLIEFRVIERISYAVEKGRLQALRETLPESDQAAELSRAARTVAQIVAPAVVSIESEIRVPVDLAWWSEPRLESSDDDGGEPDEAVEEPESGDNREDSTPRAERPVPVRQGLASGFVFDAEHGYILTNAHVVDGAEPIRVYLADGRKTEAKVLGSDPESDLAVVQIELRELHELSLGDSKAASVGDDVFAVGNPFGLEGTVTKGIISAVDRRNVRIGGSLYGSLLQTDAVISPGNSGGPLVNVRGEVIGISTGMATSTGVYDGVGFAVPSSRAREILGDLIEGGPGILGVWVGTVSDPDRRSDAAALGWTEGYGVVVSEVIPGTAADRDGIKPDDIILAMNGTDIDSSETLASLIARTKPGTQVSLHVWRDRQRITLPVRIGRKYAPRKVPASGE